MHNLGNNPTIFSGVSFSGIQYKIFMHLTQLALFKIILLNMKNSQADLKCLFFQIFSKLLFPVMILKIHPPPTNQPAKKNHPKSPTSLSNDTVSPSLISLFYSSYSIQKDIIT